MVSCLHCVERRSCCAVAWNCAHGPCFSWSSHCFRPRSLGENQRSSNGKGNFDFHTSVLVSREPSRICRSIAWGLPPDDAILSIARKSPAETGGSGGAVFHRLIAKPSIQAICKSTFESRTLASMALAIIGESLLKRMQAGFSLGQSVANFRWLPHGITVQPLMMHGMAVIWYEVMGSRYSSSGH